MNPRPVVPLRLSARRRERCIVSPICGILKETKLLWEGSYGDGEPLEGELMKRGNLVERRISTVNRV
jgi:hypothetical protein